MNIAQRRKLDAWSRRSLSLDVLHLSCMLSPWPSLMQVARSIRQCTTRTRDQLASCMKSGWQRNLSSISVGMYHYTPLRRGLHVSMCQHKVLRYLRLGQKSYLMPTIHGRGQPFLSVTGCAPCATAPACPITRSRNWVSVVCESRAPP